LLENRPSETSGQTLWQERAARLFVSLAVGALVYFFSGTILRLLLPFVLAACLAALLRPLAARMARKSRISPKVVSVLLLIGFLLLIGSLVFSGCQRLIWELQRLIDQIGTDGEGWSRRISEIMEVLTGLSEHIPFLSHIRESNHAMTEFWQQVDARLAEILSDALTRLSSRIPELIASVIRAIPSTAIFFLTFLLAAFYLCADLSGIKDSLFRLFPARWQERVGQGAHRLRELGGNYLRAYFLLFLMTFVELLLGFTFLRLPYIVLPALLIALVDILPVLGVGTVLVPWALVELLRGNGGRGGGLLALCAVVLLIRQLTEPRIVGKSIGLHPLATLFSAYAGLQVFGLAGMLLGPAVALLIKGWVVPRREGSI
jgi:sporulation integral membrane protein YtvI